jgi:hypothetical protein
MFLPGALLVLFLTGCWLYCLTDAALTPAAEYRRLPKAVWVGIIAVTFIVGAVAWLIARRSPGRGPRPSSGATRGVHHSSGDYDHPERLRWTAADEAVARHPAGRSRNVGPAGWTAPKGPDDDPEFLLALDRVIRGNADTGEDR